MKPITLTKAQEERAQELHNKYLFIDCLCGNRSVQPFRACCLDIFGK